MPALRHQSIEEVNDRPGTNSGQPGGRRVHAPNTEAFCVEWQLVDCQPAEGERRKASDRPAWQCPSPDSA